MKESPRQALIRACRPLVEALGPDELERWRELWEDAVTDFQRICLEATLLAGHPLAEVHAFGDAIRDWKDGPLAEACRPPPGDRDQDPLRAFGLNGHSLTPRPKVPPKPPPAPPARLLDLTGGVGPPRYANVLDSHDAGGRRQAPGASRSPVSEGSAEGVFSAAGAPFGLHFLERRAETDAELERAVEEAGQALAQSIPVPVVLGRAPGDLRSYALLLQIQGEGARRAFQLHDPFRDETVWINQRDLARGRDLPLEDRTLRRITAFFLPG